MQSQTLMTKKLVRERRGAMLVFVAIAGVVLMGFLAMTLDIGSGARQRRHAQTAADAGASGGGQEILRKNYSLVVDAATAEAVRNGFDAGDVTVNYPPATGTFAGDSQYVEVVVNKTIPTIFGSIFNKASMSIEARGTAGVSSYALNCLYTLDPAASAALEVSPGGELSTNCGVVVNSDASDAVDLGASGKIYATGSGIGISGDYTGGGGSVASPEPATGIASVPNPLSSITMPTVGACTVTGPLVVSGTATLSPGVYCGGISVGAGGGGGAGTNVANLNPGTYIMAGGGLTVGNSGAIYGDGVTIIVTTGSYPFKAFQFGTGCKAKLIAPSSGAYKGIVMFQDPASPPTPTSTFACASDDEPEIVGSIYLPGSSIEFNGSNTMTTIQGAVIANQVIVSGKINIESDTSGNSAVQRLALVR
jgi:hypothetical protein